MFINYRKLAEQLNHGRFKEEVVKTVAEIIANKLIDNGITDTIVNNLVVRKEDSHGYHGYTEHDLNNYVANEVADRLIPDVYNLQKAEILKDVHKEGVLNILHSKLEDQAKQHVLDFITKPHNSGI